MRMRAFERFGKPLFALLIGLAIAFPILYGLSISLMPNAQIVAYPPKILPVSVSLNNYQEALSMVPMMRFVWNSLVVSLGATAAQLITSSLAAYAFVFFDFKGRKFLFIAVLTTMMIPYEATLISNYLNISGLRLVDSYAGLILPFTASAMGIFMIRQHYLTMPAELREAARMDGCGDLRFFLSILTPLSMPALGALAVYSFINMWNQYMWPLLVTNSASMRTVQIGISMLQFDDALSFGPIMAGFVMILIPSILIFSIGQRQMIGGLTAGAVKG